MSKFRAVLFFAFTSAVSPAIAHAQATTYVVTTTVDCSGCGSLRDAISSANAHANPFNGLTIDLSGISGTISLTSPLPTIRQGMRIVGPATPVTITGDSRAFTIDAAVLPNVSFSNVSIANSALHLGAGWVVVETPSFFGPGATVTGNAALTRLDLPAGSTNIAGMFFPGPTSMAANAQVTVGSNGQDVRVFVGMEPPLGTMTKLGAGDFFLSSSQGNFVVNGGDTFVTSTGPFTGMALGTNFVNNTRVVIDYSGSPLFNGQFLNPWFPGPQTAMSGTGSLEKVGSGAVFIAGRNTYTGGTFVRGGTVAGFTFSLQGAIANEGTVYLAGGGSFNGTISGSGNVRAGGGVIFTTRQTYTGGTQVLGGTVTLQGVDVLDPNGAMNVTGFLFTDGQLNVNASNQVGNLSGTTSGRVQLGSGASLTVNQSGDTTYAGQMFGAGSLVKAGNGKLTLTNALSYTGGTAILGGTLEGTTASLQGTFVNNATLAFNQALPGTFAGSVSGSGHVIFGGGADYLLTGVNTYTGGTTLNGGGLRGTATSIQGAINNFGQVVFDQTTDGVHAGAISGTGSVVKQGAGSLLMTGSNSYTGGTIVTAGALVGTTSSLQGAIANSAMVRFDQSSAGTFSGIISGTGAVQKSGSGLVTLSGAQTYSGGTFILAGTLGGDTQSLRGAIVNDAALQFDQSFSGAFSGAISGTGRVVKRGAGTLSFLTANSYTGGTEMAGGTLAVASDASLGGSGGITFSGGTLQVLGDFSSGRAVNLAGAGVFDTNGFTAMLTGAITGNGSFTKRGAGTLILTGINSYSGGTTVESGALVGTTTNLFGSIANRGIIAFDQTSDGTFGGHISGTGSVVKTGTGVLTFSGAQTYTGLTDILAGTLRLNGSLAGSVRVASGATLNTGGVPVAPLFAADASVTIGIAGDLLLERGSTYQAVVDEAGVASTLNVTGTAYIDNATLNLARAAQNVSFARVASTPLVQAGSIVGGFGTVTGLSGNLQAFVLPGSNQISLLLLNTASDLGAFGSTTSASAAGTALSSLQQIATGDLAFVLRELRALETDAELAGALDDISGAHHAAVTGVNTLAASEVADVIGGRFVRPGGPWLQALGRTVRFDDRVDPASSSSTGAGSLAGFDWTTSRGVIGLAGGFTRDTLKIFAREDQVEDMAYRAAIYGEQRFGDAFVTVIASGARHDVEGRRSMAFAARLNGRTLFGGVDRTAGFEYATTEMSIAADAGYRLRASGFTLRPSAGLHVVRLSRGAFDETGAGSLSLAFGSEAARSQSLRFRFAGVRESARRLTPHFDVRYARELGDRAVPFTASLSGASFTSASFRLPASSFAGTAGLSFDLGPAALTADYRLSVALGQRQHLVSIGIAR